MEDYPSNSIKPKEPKKDSIPEKKVEKIVTNPVKVKKKSDIRKIADVFVSEDISNVKSYVLMDVLVPAFKKLIDDIVSDGVHMILYGGTGRDRRGSGASRISYGGFYPKDNTRPNTQPSRIRSAYDYDDVIIQSRGEAQDVLDRLDEAISKYGLISVADFYDLVGITGDYTDYKYGWTDISSASIVRTRDGYMIKFPKALPLN